MIKNIRYHELKTWIRYHELKTWSEYYSAIVEPNLKLRKTLEIRKNDRNYKVGDYLHLIETDKLSGERTGRSTWRLVTHIVDKFPFVQDGYIAMSIIEDVPIGI